MAMSTVERVKTDVILPMTREWMDHIISGAKNYEFRKYRLKDDVERLWFYMNAPESSLQYICEINPARTRNPRDPPLKEDGIGNKEYNERDPDYAGYDYAYRVRSVYALKEPITLAMLKERYGLGAAPRGMSYLPVTIAEERDWKVQKKLLVRDLDVADGGEPSDV